ncbi:MAG: DUF2891 domain-containing protein [Chloroflexota bacterium]
MLSLLEQFIPTTIANLQREYPNGIQHVFVDEQDAPVPRPRTLHPAFYGCFDWHSSVHCHWQLVRAIRLFPDADFVPAATAALNQNLTKEKLAVELAYLQKRRGYEMPYGIAWLLQLTMELRTWRVPEAQAWHTLLTPLETHAANAFHRYLSNLPYPIRSGVHNQTAFALGLVLDWARVAQAEELANTIEQRVRDFYADDKHAPLAYEPSASDFLSPALAEADIMRRVLPQTEFSDWLWGFFGPDMATQGSEQLLYQLTPVNVVDFANGQLAHFAGLNMSRAWMLMGVAHALPADDNRRAMLLEVAEQHRTMGMSAALHDDYMVSHWATTFVMYLVTEAWHGASTLLPVKP